MQKKMVFITTTYVLHNKIVYLEHLVGTADNVVIFCTPCGGKVVIWY